MKIFSKQIYIISTLGSEKSKMFSKLKCKVMSTCSIFYSDSSKRRIIKSKVKLIRNNTFMVYSSDIKE